MADVVADTAALVINSLVYSEVPVGFEAIEVLDEALSPRWFRREPLPWAAGFPAGNVFGSIAGPVASAVRHCRISISVRMPRSWVCLC